LAHFITRSNTPPSITHLNLSVAATISLILAPGVSLSQATAAVEDQVRKLGMPASIRGNFEGTVRTLSGVAR
jgi:multidrug efflux pump